MGSFDFVRYKADCIKCGAKLSDFQSKDADCSLAELSPIEVRTFYTSCGKCRQWNEFRVVPTGYTVVRVQEQELTYGQK